MEINKENPISSQDANAVSKRKRDIHVVSLDDEFASGATKPSSGKGNNNNADNADKVQKKPRSDHSNDGDHNDKKNLISSTQQRAYKQPNEEEPQLVDENEDDDSLDDSNYKLKYKNLLLLRVTKPEQMAQKFKDHAVAIEAKCKELVQTLHEENTRLTEELQSLRRSHESVMNKNIQMKDEALMELRKENTDLKHEIFDLKSRIKQHDERTERNRQKYDEMKEYYEKRKAKSHELKRRLKERDLELQRLNNRHEAELRELEERWAAKLKEQQREQEDRERTAQDVIATLNEKVDQLNDLISFYKMLTSTEVEVVEGGDKYVCTCTNAAAKRVLQFSLGLAQNSSDVPEDGEQAADSADAELDYVPIRRDTNGLDLPHYLTEPISFAESSTPLFLSKILGAMYGE